MAQAVVEYLYEKVGARCLFATHYHELTYLQNHYDGIANYYADSKQTPQGILFLHKIIQGVAHQSFGLQVAKLANLPTSVLLRAQQLVEQFEKKDQKIEQLTFLPSKKNIDHQDDWKVKYDQLAVQMHCQQEIINLLQHIDYNNLSPKLAFDTLWNLQQKLNQ